MKTWAFLTILILTAFFIGGCGGGSLHAYDVDVSLDPAVTSAEVDLVGVSEAQLSQWDSYSLSSYFGGDDPMRAGSLRYPIVFGPGSSAKQTVARNDPIWSKWKQAGATRLAILAQWPGGSGRQILPLDPAVWEGRRIGVVVQKPGLKIEGRKPDKTQS